MRASFLPACLLVPMLALTASFAEQPTLKEAYHGQFLVGVALGAPPDTVYSPVERALAVAQFDAATPENCLKPKTIHPAENQWDFADGDAFVDFCTSNGLVIFGHTLVWDHSPPWWFLEKGKPASREVMLARMRNYVHRVVERYRGRIRGWDVVNEALSDEPGEYLHDSPWVRGVGDDFIVQAFRFAHEADPKAELQYNDFHIEWPEKRPKVIRLIRELKAAGVPITSVGIQGHWQMDHVPFRDIEDSIVAFAAEGVKVAITELDLDVIPRHTTGAAATAKERFRAADARPAPCPPEKLKQQAEQYAELFRIFRRHRAQIERVTFWGLDDGHSWLNSWPSRRYDHPLLWDRDLRPKPALATVIAAAKS